MGTRWQRAESTGVYWIPLFEILEQRGIRPCLVTARHMKNVPGRRTDWHECQWLQFLHSVGFLRAAFRPGQDVCAVRTILRHRNELVAAASQHVQHMHKAVRLSYHADQSFHEGTSRSSRATSPPPRYPCRRSAGRQYRGWEYCIDAAQETGSSSKTCDGPGYRTTGSERGPKSADVKQQGS
jgi:hypothetical protein